MCNNFEEVIKGQSNRELLSDFRNLLESAVTLALGHDLGGAVKPKNASDAQMTRALDVIVIVQVQAVRNATLVFARPGARNAA